MGLHLTGTRHSSTSETSSGRLVPLLLAAWFGIAAGLVEGLGLLLFQRIDWRQWGVTIHVSTPILWISPLVDLAVFLSIAAGLMLGSRLWRGLPVFQAAVFFFVSLTVYDWLLVPRRLYHSACFLLAVGLGTFLSQRAKRYEAPIAGPVRRSLPVLVTIFVAVLIAVPCSRRFQEHRALAALPAAKPGSPNVLVIIVDTLRADHVSAYGYSRETTPNIDRLAREGVLFENAVSATSWTFPAHVSLLTGSYPFEDGLGRVPPMPLWNGGRLIKSPMIGEELERRGYRTAAFSANRVYFDRDLGFGPGFIHFEDYFFSPADMVSRTVFGREFVRWILPHNVVLRLLAWLHVGGALDFDAERSGEAWMVKSHPPRKRGEEIDREVLHWIGNSPQAHPFFAVLNYFDVHFPYGGPPSYSKPAWGQDQRGDRYDDGVKYVDDCIGRLMAELTRRGMGQNTLVVIVGDHGEMLGEHGLTGHGKSLYWPLIHVPLIFWYPGHIPAGVRVARVVSSSFLPVTLSSWLPGKVQWRFPGDSLANLWASPLPDRDGTALAELSYNALDLDLKHEEQFPVPTDLQGAMRSVISGRWHLIMHKQLGNQLYDWQSDPSEAHNLINAPQGEEIVGKLTNDLLDLLAGRQMEKEGIEQAVNLNPNGRTHIEYVRSLTEPARVNDYYLLHASPGAAVTLEVHDLKSEGAGALDSVLAVEDAQGRILLTCRNTEDDHLPLPGTSDATPEAFDDACVNDDIRPGVQSASRLQVRVPGRGEAPADLYIRVSDWNGRFAAAGTSYQITADEAVEAPVAGTTLMGQKKLN